MNKHPKALEKAESIDLVKRMRRYSYTGGTDNETGQLIAELVSDMHKAADRIETLECDLEMCEKNAKAFFAQIGRLAKIIEENTSEV